LVAVSLYQQISIVSIKAHFGLRDRFRTTLNVMGDAFGAGIVQHLSRKQLGIGIENQPVDTDTDCLGNQETEQ
jgi:Na+/H+-dicarboxylate symporter